MKKRIHVAVGVLLNNSNEVLIAKRPDHVHQGGLWEFPGGKVEEGESAFDALVREFKEEVAITIEAADEFVSIHHDYTDKEVNLIVYLSRQFSGEATGLEGQEVRWLALEDLKHYSFPEANKTIISQLLER